MTETQREPGPVGRSRVAAAYFVFGLLAVAAIAGAIAWVSQRDGGGATSAPAQGFAPRYEGMEQRRLAAGVPTMAEGGGEHFHSKLSLYAGGKKIEVPANIGIDPTQPPGLMVGLHTHDSSGTIHNEAGSGATLGDFFAIWGVQLSGRELGPYTATSDHPLRMWVDGEPSDEFGDLTLEDGQEIVIAYGEPPPGIAGG